MKKISVKSWSLVLTLFITSMMMIKFESKLEKNSKCYRKCLNNFVADCSSTSSTSVQRTCHFLKARARRNFLACQVFRLTFTFTQRWSVFANASAYSLIGWPTCVLIECAKILTSLFFMKFLISTSALCKGTRVLQSVSRADLESE